MISSGWFNNTEALDCVWPVRCSGATTFSKRIENGKFYSCRNAPEYGGF